MEPKGAMISLVSYVKRYKVSSVLNHDTAEYGKKHLFDNEPETCWNSEPGSPQFILIIFKDPVHVEEVEIIAQGGFCPRDVEFWVGKSEDLTELQKTGNASTTFEDINTKQRAKILCSEKIQTLKITILSSYDFFGRVTLYGLDILGHP